MLPFSHRSSKETSPKSTGYHVVMAGDTLWGIAKKYYGDGSKCNIIFNANKDKIKNPSLIMVGWKLKIPDKSEFSKYKAPLPKTVTNKPKLSNEHKGGVSETDRNHSSARKKIVIYESDYNTYGYNAQGYSGGVSPSGRSHSSGNGKF